MEIRYVKENQGLTETSTENQHQEEDIIIAKPPDLPF